MCLLNGARNDYDYHQRNDSTGNNSCSCSNFLVALQNVGVGGIDYCSGSDVVDTDGEKN